MILATTTIDDLDTFVKIYGTTGADKRKLHGSKGSTVFRDPNDAERVWAIFDWDLDGWATSLPIPRCRRSCRRPGTRAGPRSASSSAGSTRNGTLRPACSRRRACSYLFPGLEA